MVDTKTENYQKVLYAMSMPRKNCFCGGKTTLEVVPNGFGNDWYVKCNNVRCTRDMDILFKDPIEAVNYWNMIGADKED